MVGVPEVISKKEVRMRLVAKHNGTSSVSFF